MRGALHPELQPRGCVCPHDGVPAGVTAGTRRASPRANQGLQSGCCGDGSKGSGRGRGDPGEEVRAHTVCARWRWAHVCWGAQRNESCVRPGAPGWRSGGAAKAFFLLRSHLSPVLFSRGSTLAVSSECILRMARGLPPVESERE